MILTFFNEKQGCGKTTLTLLIAKSLENLFKQGEENSRRIFIFDTAHSVKNSLALKENQEEKSENSRIFIKYVENYQDFEIQKIEFSITDKDLIFFDLQDFTQKQFDFISHSEYVIVVSDHPNELESVDRQIYQLLEKIKNSPYQNSISIKKIFLTQNRVCKNEQIVSDFENVNYIEGLSELPKSLQIETISIYKKENIPTSVQRFALDIFKQINDYQEQIIV